MKPWHDMPRISHHCMKKTDSPPFCFTDQWLATSAVRNQSAMDVAVQQCALWIQAKSASNFICRRWNGRIAIDADISQMDGKVNQWNNDSDVSEEIKIL